MTEKEYNAAPGVRRSDLWYIKESPEKFKYHIENPEEQTPALTFGSMVHKLLLEPKTFADEFAVAPMVDRRTKAGKEEWAAFCERSEGKTVVTLEDYDAAIAMVGKAMTDPTVMRLLVGVHEVPYAWTDKDTGIQCKIRCDCVTQLDTLAMPVIVDYKTANNASTQAFTRDAVKYGYFFQAAMYAEGVKQATGSDLMPLFAFIVQEKKPPYAINVCTVSGEDMAKGMDIFRELIGIYRECLKSGDWYGYLGPLHKPNELKMPPWAELKEAEADE